MFFKMSFFASLSYKCIKVWYFHDQYKASSLGTNGISNNIFDLHRVSKVAAHFQKKKMFKYSFKYPKEESRKSVKKRGCRAVFGNLPNIYSGTFLHHKCF